MARCIAAERKKVRIHSRLLSGEMHQREKAKERDGVSKRGGGE
jgi:Trp operon repressor